MRSLLLLCLALQAHAQTTVRYWAGAHEKAELAQWAMEAWAEASGGLLLVERVQEADKADIRFRWINPERRGLYGQSFSMKRDGKMISEIVVNPNLETLGPDMAKASQNDALYGEVILFLTCVHEAGHALGPVHTRDYADIMYSFEHGGDFVAYFQRYRNRLKSRLDMRKNSPLSLQDISQIKAAARRQQQTEKR